jgi:hypothetical protein
LRFIISFWKKLAVNFSHLTNQKPGRVVILSYRRTWPDESFPKVVKSVGTHSASRTFIPREGLPGRPNIAEGFFPKKIGGMRTEIIFSFKNEKCVYQGETKYRDYFLAFWKKNFLSFNKFHRKFLAKFLKLFSNFSSLILLKIFLLFLLKSWKAIN